MRVFYIFTLGNVVLFALIIAFLGTLYFGFRFLYSGIDYLLSVIGIVPKRLYDERGFVIPPTSDDYGHYMAVAIAKKEEKERKAEVAKQNKAQVHDTKQEAQINEQAKAMGVSYEEFVATTNANEVNGLLAGINKRWIYFYIIFLGVVLGVPTLVTLLF